MSKKPMHQSRTLEITEFGNPILRKVAAQILPNEVLQPKLQQLIADMRHTLTAKKLGVGLAAPQVGESIALAVISIRPLPHRKKVERFEAVLINPEITETSTRKYPMWEGCISCGSGKAGLFAQVPRYKKVKIKYFDEKGAQHHREFKGLVAHVIQHEVDHLNGTLFIDKVKDTQSFMTYSEYVKHVQKIASKQQG